MVRRSRRYVAFLRAINVGGHTVKMTRLRASFESLGFTNVETFIASGNVIFESPSASVAALERRIEQRLRDELGYDVATFVRTLAEISAAATHRAFPPFVEPLTLWVGFVRAEPSATGRLALTSCETATDAFHVHGRELYWLRTRMSDSKVTGKQLERAIGMPFTMRNVTTLRRLAAKYPSDV